VARQAQGRRNPRWQLAGGGPRGGCLAAVRAAAGWRRPGGARARAEAAGWTATACPSGGAKQGRHGAAVPAAVGPGGGGAKRCEHQYGRAAPVLALAWRGAARAGRAACGGGE